MFPVRKQEHRVSTAKAENTALLVWLEVTGGEICESSFVPTLQFPFSCRQVIVPDPWKAGSTNNTEGGGRKVNENKLLTAKKNRFNPYQGEAQFKTCKICKTKVHQVLLLMTNSGCNFSLGEFLVKPPTWDKEYVPELNVIKHFLIK